MGTARELRLVLATLLCARAVQQRGSGSEDWDPWALLGGLALGERNKREATKSQPSWFETSHATLETVDHVAADGLPQTSDHVAADGLPSEPGCYMRFPSGCWRFPASAQVAQWQHERMAEQGVTPLNPREGCMNRARVWNKYCSVTDCEMFFVPGKVMPRKSTTTMRPLLENVEETSETPARAPTTTTSPTTTLEPVQNIMSHIENRSVMSDFVQEVDKEAEAEFNEEKRAAADAEEAKASDRERRIEIRRSAEKAQGLADAKKDTMEKTRKLLRDQASKVRHAAKDVEAKNETLKAAREARAAAAAGVEQASRLIHTAQSALAESQEQVDAQEADGFDPSEALRQRMADQREAVAAEEREVEDREAQLQRASRFELEAVAALQAAEAGLSAAQAEQRPLDERLGRAVAEYEAARDYANIRTSLANSTRDLESAEARAEADRKAAAEKQLREEHQARQRAAAEKAEREANEAAEREREGEAAWANLGAAEKIMQEAESEDSELEPEMMQAPADEEARAKEEAEWPAKAAEEAQEVRSSPAVPTPDLSPVSTEALPAVSNDAIAEKLSASSAEGPISTGVSAEHSGEITGAAARVPATEEGRLPADPGCYTRMPTGCQSHGGGATRWRLDRWTQDRGLGEQGCMRRKDVWDHYCERTDVEMGYVAAQASPEVGQSFSEEDPEVSGDSGSKPMSALQLGGSPAWPWPWSKKPMMDKANASAQRDAEAEAMDAYPSEPGCYMKMASGCPQNPMKTDLWRHDPWAERRGLDRAGCEGRKRVWDAYCAASDAKVVFVSSRASSEAVSALQLGGSPAWPWPWSKKLAVDTAKAGAQREAESIDAYPSEPGCYMRMASGCPKNPMKTDVWRHDSWAERNGLDEAGCKLRKRVWDKYCAAEDAAVVFVSSEASSQR
mmetsp:Transcript_33674/g.96294  ORF Transcript_33674/g.96294 Transcript_33674/m.96294 type:complete len:909 (-) Transcript_33674:83-2809(-)